MINEYQEILIPIKQLQYLWMDIRGNEQACMDWMLLYLKIERNLKYNNFVDNFDDDTQFKRDQISVQIVGESIEKYGMINPLWVYRVDYDAFVVLKGNQRLCWHRSKDYDGSLRCVISPAWNTLELEENVPYKNIPFKVEGEHSFFKSST